MFKLTHIAVIIITLLTTQMLNSQEISIRYPDPVNIMVIAGQSNAINIHADAADMQSDLIDTTTAFYYHCGMPPDRNLPFFSTSENKWTKLKTQTQVPYLAHKENFFGPEITLVKGLSISYENIAVIKCAYGGSSLAVDWNPDADSGNMLYSTMMEQISNACSLLTDSGVIYLFSGFFWIQGEADASNKIHAEAYYDNLKRLIESVRNNLNTPELPFIISRLPSGQPYENLNTIRNAQEKATQDITLTKWVDTDNLELDKDSIHFISPGVKTLGYLMAESLVNVPSGNEKYDPQLNNFILQQNYPNPFNPATSIRYHLGAACKVYLKVYDVLGNEIAVLVNDEQPAGSHQILYNPGNMAAGVYFYRLQADSFVESKKMVMTK